VGNAFLDLGKSPRGSPSEPKATRRFSRVGALVPCNLALCVLEVLCQMGPMWTLSMLMSVLKPMVRFLLSGTGMYWGCCWGGIILLAYRKLSRGFYAAVGEYTTIIF